MTRPEAIRAVLLDLDGTLVDSVHLHVTAWAAALRGAGHDVPLTAIHAGIGLGGDRLVTWLLGAAQPDADALAAHHLDRFLGDDDLLVPTDGAQQLLDDLAAREVPHAIVTSAGGEEREALLACLEVPDDLPILGPSDDDASKPAPDLVRTACAALEVSPDAATVVGDAAWDALAARAIGASSIAVRCGGIPDAVLSEAGATRIVDAPRDLVAILP